MDLIIGGAYQGKLDYAIARFSLDGGDIFTCTEDGGMDFSKQCLNKLEEYTLWSVRNNIDAVGEFKNHAVELQNSVLICCDIFCGVVPIAAEMRAWREATGRLCNYLARESDTVTRIFCGLEQRLK